MAKFTFNLPNGQLFTLDGPPGATVIQAEKIFLEQLASGAFVGLQPGDILQSSTTTTVTQFELSRLDRGTAGVQDIPLIAIYNSGLDYITSAATRLGSISTSNITVISSIPSLANVPINNGITLSDYIEQTTVTEPIGPLTANQVQAVLASIAAFVCQPVDVITNESGLGKYGFNAEQLEAAGYLKPGTSARFLGGQ
jgi:hypothetical protein